MSHFYLGLLRKLACTKPKQSTDKVSKHNNSAVFSQAMVLSGHQQECCQLCLILYPLFITLTHNLRILPCLCLHCHQRQSKPSPWFGRACESIQPRRPPTSGQGRYDYSDVPCCCQPLRQQPRLQGRIHHLAP